LKKIKSMLCSLLLCLCMCFSVFAACSPFQKQEDYTVPCLTIGTKTLTKQDVIDAYYSFYQSNSYYLAYYDDAYIEKIFYESLIAREIILQKAEEALKDNEIYYTAEDMQKTWEDTFDFIYGQIDTKEKALLLLADSNEENLPERLKTEESSKEKAYKYEPYKFERVEDIYTNEGKTQAEPYDIDQIIEQFLEGVYQYNSSKTGDRTMVDIEDQDEIASRKAGFERYLSSLILSAKANNKNADKDEVLKQELLRVYNNNYENTIYATYQDYYNSTAVSTGKFGDEAIIDKYEALLKASVESNVIEDNYLSVIGSSDNDTLILYHYNGEFTYFTVQHILIKFNSEVTEILKNTDGYDSSKHNIYRDSYETIRDSYVSNDMTTTYRDENGYTVKDNDGNALKITLGEIKSLYYAELQTRLGKLDGTYVGELTEEEQAAAQEYASMTPEEKTLAQERVHTLLFNEFAWKYSADTGSLTNEKLAGVLGFTISEEADERGGYVIDFANGARELFNEYLTGNGSIGIGQTVKQVVSDYGVHLMVLTGVYDAGTGNGKAVVELTGNVAQDIETLDSTYVSYLTNQSLYEYVYDMVKNSLVGDNGTYFSDYRKSELVNYKKEGLVKEHSKMSLDQLNNAIN